MGTVAEDFRCSFVHERVYIWKKVRLRKNWESFYGSVAFFM
jgi:hypothetical protein